MKAPKFIREYLAREWYDTRHAILFDLAFEMCVNMGYTSRQAYEEWLRIGGGALIHRVQAKYNLPTWQPR